MQYNIFILLALLTFSVSCQSQDRPDLPAVYKTKGMIPYAHDDRSDSLGNPRDSLAFYFPPEAILRNAEAYSFTDRKNNLHILVEPDANKSQLAEQYRIDWNSITDTSIVVPNTSWNQWLSYNFYKLKEPVLSNYYLSDTVYRVTWIPSAGLGPISMRIIKGSQPIIVSKMLTFPLQEPGGLVFRDMSDGGIEKRIEPSPIIFRTDTMRPLEPGALREIDSLFAQVDFKEMPYNSNCDGGYTIYEMQTKEGYYFFVKCLRGRSSIYSKILFTLMKYSDLDKPTKNMFLSD